MAFSKGEEYATLEENATTVKQAAAEAAANEGMNSRLGARAWHVQCKACPPAGQPVQEAGREVHGSCNAGPPLHRKDPALGPRQGPQCWLPSMGQGCTCRPRRSRSNAGRGCPWRVSLHGVSQQRQGSPGSMSEVARRGVGRAARGAQEGSRSSGMAGVQPGAHWRRGGPGQGVRAPRRGPRQASRVGDWQAGSSAGGEASGAGGRAEGWRWCKGLPPAATGAGGVEEGRRPLEV